MAYILSETPSVGNHFMAELRDAEIQQDSMRFRKNMERLGEIFAYEISKDFSYTDTEFETPLGTATIQVFNDHPVLATILRAGLPLHQGLLNYFDKADSVFISPYRKNTKGRNFFVEIEHISSPPLTGRTVIICDPMIATGESMVLCCKELSRQFQLKELHIVTVIASKVGLAHVKANLPNAKVWIGDIDEELTTRSFIVPGLGDAGDLAYGLKE